MIVKNLKLSVDIKSESMRIKVAKTAMFITLLFGLILFSTLASATVMNQLIEINGVLYMNTTFGDGSSKLVQVVYVDGVAYLNITYDDGSSGLEALSNYITEHEGQWSTDTVGGGGITLNDVVNLIIEAVNYLKGLTGTSNQAIQIANTLDSYFASDYDVYVLSNQLSQYDIRIQALEKTMNTIAEDAYCNAKMELMLEYNLSWIKCGEKSTYYYRVDANQWNGNDIVGIKLVPEIETSAPNITVVKLDVPELKAGENNTVTVTLKNEGDKIGSVNVSLNLPADWQSYPEFQQIGISPNETKTIEFLVFVPSNASGKSKITGLATFTIGNETKEASGEVEANITAKVVPIVESMTGLFTLVASNSIYAELVALFLIALVLMYVRWKVTKKVFKVSIKKMYKTLNKFYSACNHFFCNLYNFSQSFF